MAKSLVATPTKHTIKQPRSYAWWPAPWLIMIVLSVLFIGASALRRDRLSLTLATAHKLTRLIYFMLNNRSDYQDPGADAYNEQYRQRVIKNLQCWAKKLGFELVPAVA